MDRRRLLYIMCAVLLLAALAANIAGLGPSMQVLLGAELGPFWVAHAATVFGYLMSALSYYFLSLHELHYPATLVVQVASGFTNRLLPAGLGGLGLFAAYYKRQGHSLPLSVSIGIANNIIGFIGTVILLAAVVIWQPNYLRQLHPPEIQLPAVYGIGLVLIMLASATIIIWRRRRSLRKQSLRSRLGTTLGNIKKISSPQAVLPALMANMALTVSLAICLSLALAAVHWHLPLAGALIALSAGTLAGAAVPSPGGLGGMEAGLFGGLIASGVPPATAVAGVLLYRLLTFWLPIIPGVIAFRYVERHYI